MLAETFLLLSRGRHNTVLFIVVTSWYFIVISEALLLEDKSILSSLYFQDGVVWCHMTSERDELPLCYSVSLIGSRLWQIAHRFCEESGYNTAEGFVSRLAPNRRAVPALYLQCSSKSNSCYFQYSRCDELLGLKCGDCMLNINITTSRNEVTLSTPGFPVTAPRVTCEWRLFIPSRHQVMLNFSSLHLPLATVRSLKCTNSYVEIIRPNVSTDPAQYIGRYCGIHPPGVLSLPGPVVVIRYVSGYWLPPDRVGGFKLRCSLSYKGLKGPLSIEAVLLQSDLSEMIFWIVFSVVIIIASLAVIFLCIKLVGKRSDKTDLLVTRYYDKSAACPTDIHSSMAQQHSESLNIQDSDPTYLSICDIQLHIDSRNSKSESNMKVNQERSTDENNMALIASQSHRHTPEVKVITLCPFFLHNSGCSCPTTPEDSVFAPGIAAAFSTSYSRCSTCSAEFNVTSALKRWKRLPASLNKIDSSNGDIVVSDLSSITAASVYTQNQSTDTEEVWSTKEIQSSKPPACLDFQETKDYFHLNLLSPLKERSVSVSVFTWKDDKTNLGRKSRLLNLSLPSLKEGTWT